MRATAAAAVSSRFISYAPFVVATGSVPVHHGGIHAIHMIVTDLHCNPSAAVTASEGTDTQ
jgi:hypothetical protein